MRKEDFLYRWVSLILKWGSYCSLALIILGLVLSLFFRKGGVGPFPSFRNQHFVPSSVSRQGAPLHLSFDKDYFPIAILNLGLLVLMFTPFFRVMTAWLSFLFSKDIKYTLISSGVFLILVFSLILALR